MDPLQIINIGAAPNDHTGDKARVAFDKARQNFALLYDAVASALGSLASHAELITARAMKGANTDIDSLSGTSAAGVDVAAGSTTLASAATVDIGAAPSKKVTITGTTGIGSFGSAPHKERRLHFSGVLTITPGSGLILPAGVPIVTQAGDTCDATSDASGSWRVRAYQRSDGGAISAPLPISRGGTGVTSLPALGFGSGLRFGFATAIVDADPGNGGLRLNNAAIASASQIFVSNLDATTGASATAYLDAFDDYTSAPTRGLLYVSDVADATKVALFRITGVVSDGGGYRKVPVAYLAGPGGFAAGAILNLLFVPTPNPSPQGELDGIYPRLDGANSGPIGDRNLLINPEMIVNIRGFAGGALAAGSYGFDRWKAGTGGATISVDAATRVIALNGPLVQVIEAPGLAGQSVTVSAESPSAAIPVTLAAVTSGTGSVSGSIPAGSGRRSVTLSVPSTATGDLSVTYAPTSSTSFARPQVEIGSYASVFRRRSMQAETALCERYAEIVAASFTGRVEQAAPLRQTFKMSTRKRATPSISQTVAGTLSNASSPSLTFENSDPTGTLRFSYNASAAGSASAVNYAYLVDSEF